MSCATRKAIPYGVGTADRDRKKIADSQIRLPPRLLGRHHLKSSDHIPIAALGMVVELSNRIPRRQALDAPLLWHDAIVARYDERLGVRGHGTPKTRTHPPIRTSGFGVPSSIPREGGSFFCPAAIGKQTSGHCDTVDLPLTLVGIARFKPHSSASVPASEMFGSTSKYPSALQPKACSDMQFRLT